jgi:hypothetical protein
LTPPLKWNSGSLLCPSTPVAPAVVHLPLLPPGPDGVHGTAPHRTRASSPLTGGKPCRAEGRGQEFDPALAGCRFRAPLPPRPARPNLKFCTFTVKICILRRKMAERVGFEPTRRGFDPSTRFPGERLRPTQPSLRAGLLTEIINILLGYHYFTLRNRF